MTDETLTQDSAEMDVLAVAPSAIAVAEGPNSLDEPQAGGAIVDAPEPDAVTPEVSASSGPERPREVVKGIHPELVCSCPECEPNYTELQWFTPEESKKVKGDAMLFCANSSRKYFSPVTELTTWIAENGGGRKRRGGD